MASDPRPQNNYKFQLISDDAHFVPGVDDKFDSLDMNSVGKKYFTVGIIGSQSSGKSTLLNHMFNTGFDVLDAKLRRSQTTKGIWVSRALNSSLLVLDIEGSDSAQRWDDFTTLERSTALFGLVLSNILIVNLWTNEVGRYKGSSYDIIKVIFDLNLRFFNQETPKKLVFVIRDFDFEGENLEYISNNINNDLIKLWDEIKKPKEFENANHNQFYQTVFIPLAHFKYKRSEFETGATNLAQRLINESNPEFLFKDVDFSKNLPFDGLSLFASKVWKQIKENKDLNLPSQKILVANTRCSLIKKEALLKADKTIKKLRARVQNEIDDSLKFEFEELTTSSLKFFESSTFQYDDQIVAEKTEELKEDLQREFQDISELQTEKIMSNCLSEFEQELNQAKTITDIGSLIASVNELKRDKIVFFRKEITNKTMCTNEDKEVSNLEEKIDASCSSFIKDRLNSSFKTFNNKKKKTLDTIFTRIFSELDVDFWDKVLDAYNNEMNNYEGELQELFKNAGSLSKQLCSEEIMNSNKIELLIDIKISLRIRFKSFRNFLLDNFKRDFNTTATGMQRNWMAIDEEEITNFFENSKMKTLQILKKAHNIEYPSLLTEQASSCFDGADLDLMANSLAESMNRVVEAVFDKKYNRNTFGNIPKWFWLILAYFAYDDIYRLLTIFAGPYIFAFVLVIAGAAAYLASTGKLDQVIALVKTLVSTSQLLIGNFTAKAKMQ